ncbi:hypothetical protein Tco_0343486, partial [Tanacetum coccineum]
MELSSKSVSLPSQSLPAPPLGQMAIRSKEDATVILSGPFGPPITSVPSQNSELVLTPSVPDITVVMLEDSRVRKVIDKMDVYVLDGGFIPSLRFRWVPPALPKDRSPENEEIGATFAAGRSRHVETEHTLIDAQIDEFEDMMRALTLERIQIKEAMGFALDNVDVAREIFHEEPFFYGHDKQYRLLKIAR